MLFINMIYIYIGYLLKKKDIMKYMDEHQNVELYSVIISVVILMASLYVFNYNTDYRAGVFTNLVLTMIIPICGFIFLSFIPKKIISSYDKVSKAFSYIGQNTIYILMYHVVCFQIVSTLLLKLGYFASSDLMNTWNNYIVVGNWKFVSILLAMSIPVIFKLLYDKLVLKIKG
jgi:fucose 4-O-acetylase-like acetyltransferase